METELIISLETRPGQAPEWLCLLPLGEVTLGDEREPFIVDQESLAAMVQRFRERGLDLVIDYEHQSLSGAKAPAAGWIKDLEAREDGLWARVEWTETARSHLEAKEYRYFSPVLRLDEATRRPAAMLHAALTNTPAINHLPPLVAKDIGHVGCALRTTVINGDDPEPQEQDRPMSLIISAKKEDNLDALLATLKQRLALQPEAATAEILALADQKFSAAAAFAEAADLLGLAADASPAQVKGAILALQSNLEQLSHGQEELAALKSRLDESRILEVVDEALKAGKITPAQKEDALKYARRDLEGFQTFVEKSLPVIPLGRLNLLPDAAPGEEQLTSSATIICEALGITPEAFKAQERRLQNARLI